MRIVLGVLVVVLLAGCAPAAPSKGEVVERMLIELEGATDGVLAVDDPDVIELAEGLADGALDGNCGKPDYWTGLAGEYDSNKSLIYAWASTCSMYFEGDMSESQREYARDLLIEQATSDIGE